MRSALILLLWLTSLPLQAATGAWHASASGPQLGHRGSWMAAKPLRPPAGVSGSITQIAWRYQLSGAAPSGLRVRLCGGQRCVTLEGGSGVTRELAQLAADETLYMTFGFLGRGSLPPGLRVISSEVMVNYNITPHSR